LLGHGAAGFVLADQVGGADPGLGQVELDGVGGLAVPCDRGDHGADLLVTGGQQERRSAPAALGTGDVETLLRVCQLALAVRRDGAAAVEVGIDHGCELHRRLGGRVELDPDLAQHLQVRAEAGGGHDGVCGQHPVPVRRDPGDLNFGTVRGGETGDGEAADQFDDTRLNGLLEA